MQYIQADQHGRGFQQRPTMEGSEWYYAPHRALFCNTDIFAKWSPHVKTQNKSNFVPVFVYFLMQMNVLHVMNKCFLSQGEFSVFDE